jgi:glycosyltransferase involved in cell wall biosynthesis
MNRQKKILFLVPYSIGMAPSQRFRVELYGEVMDAAGFSYRIQSFLSARKQKKIYQQGKYFGKVLAIVSGLMKRWWTVFFISPAYDFVFIHREASPVGPPFFEWFLRKVYRKKIIFDFDDAIWISNTSESNKIAGWAKCSWKVKYICRWSYKIVGGNEYLCAFARQYNGKVFLIPTCVDTEKGHGQVKSTYFTDLPVIGWTGSHSTLKYLDEILPLLKRLQEQYDFCFTVIADSDPQLSLKNYHFIRWQAATENEDLLQLDIGIMPLTPDEWSEGKCGFKLIQYFATGIPSVASPVGVNKKIIEEGVNGFLCSTEKDWERALITLLQDAALRERMGKAGREKVERKYSLIAQREEFLRLFT